MRPLPLPLSQKSFMNSTAFNGEDSEKSTTRSSTREHLNWELKVLSRAQVGTSIQATFDLLLTARINDKASVLSEIAFGEGDAQKFDVDLERVLFKYDYNDHLRMSFGRYQTGIGYYNTAFHHGSWLQTTADRPLILTHENLFSRIRRQHI